MSDQEINSCTVLCGPSYNTVLTGYEDHGVSVLWIYNLEIYFKPYSPSFLSVCFFAYANHFFPR